MTSFPGASVIKKKKNPPANAGDTGSIPADSLEKEMATQSNILAWQIPGQRSLARYSPWSHKRVRHELVAKQLR